MSPHRQDAPALPAAVPPRPEAPDAGTPPAPAVPEVGCPTADGQIVLYTGKTTASYFWDDGSGINGDTGAPASGKPMQKGLAASPSWPMGTKGYVIYKGKKADFFIGDRGPGIPSSNGVMLDLDGKTFAELTGGTWDTDSLTVEDAGGLGHIPVTYVITEWGEGLGKTGAPRPFSTGAYAVEDRPEPPPPCPTAAPAPAAPASADPAAASEGEEGPAQQAQAAAAGMSPVAGRARAKDAASPATAPRTVGSSTAPSEAARSTAKAPEKTAAKTSGTTVSPAFTPASAVNGQLEEAAVPAFSIAIVVCALVAVGAKAVLSRPAHAHGTAHRPGRHRGR
ncbi:hypothetical protein GCM10010116_03070 [Microbispora rosea subsp. aerata]|nr:hypothetical protein [Microbispora rosea]GGO01654.1 hypothetical protein GCM10010116_03070 [Microbispora rosea subsp. aerata]GIH58321.1 hypothetical protein Mro02_52350 [Microbispora rosea subsp. aerata]GLJ87167.1 hypothetical protein GCM10017588_59110 [Microbispora rosea subsp. aerata]